MSQNVGSQKGIVVVNEAGGAGALVWWHLSGPVNGEALRAAWSAAGLDEKLLPDLPSPDVALTRAMAELRSRGRLVRSIRSGGYQVTDEQVAAGTNALGLDTLEYHPVARAWLDAAGRVRVEALNGAPVGELAGQVVATFEHAVDNYDTVDVSGWLAQLARERFSAVGLRDNGGVYYVPPQHLPEWERAVAALEGCSGHRVAFVPAMRTDKAVASILAEVEREAAAEADSMSADLESGKFGARGLRNRADRCGKVLAKVQEYEAVLGGSLDAIRKRVEDLQASVTVAALQAEAEEEDARAAK